MRIEVFPCGPLGANCYFVHNGGTGEMFLIDPGGDADILLRKVEASGDRPVGILLTHGHFDHVGGCREIAETYRIPYYVSEADASLMTDAHLNMAYPFHYDTILYPDRILKENEVFSLAGFRIQVVPTPGHTAGSVCYWLEDEKTLFSGDTLFYETFGKTDCPTASFGTLIASIRRLLRTLPEDIRIYPGHGASTTVGHEKKYNPARGTQ